MHLGALNTGKQDMVSLTPILSVLAGCKRQPPNLLVGKPKRHPPAPRRERLSERGGTDCVNLQLKDSSPGSR